MARQTVNIGTNSNDGTGDKLRDAMVKINANFVELYAQTPLETNLTITSNTITVNNTNGDLVLDPNGTGQLILSTGAVINADRNPNSIFYVRDSSSGDVLTVNPEYKNVGINTTANTQGLNVVGNVTFTGANTTINSNVVLGTESSFVQLAGKLSSPIVPLVDNAFNLGGPSESFKDFFTANVHSIDINTTTLDTTTANVGNIRISGESTMGNLVIRGNEISNNILDEDIEIKPFGVGNVFVNTKMIIGSGPTPMVNPYLQITGAANNFTQVGVQNINTGKFACSDMVVFNDQGSDFFNFICMGHNNSGWDGSLQYVYFANSSDAATWAVGQTVYQLDPSDGSSILAQGTIDEVTPNPLNASEIRIRVCQIYQGTTGLFEQGSVAGLVYNIQAGNDAMPQEHLLQTITSTGAATYGLGTTGTLNSSTARAVFGPTVIMAADSIVVRVNGNLLRKGIDYTTEFNRVRFYNPPSIGSVITIRQLPEANYPFTIGTEADAYFYNNGNKLTFGTMSGHDVVFHANGTRYDAEAGRIRAETRNWQFGSHTNGRDGAGDTGERVQVRGNLRVDGRMVQPNNAPTSSIGDDGDKIGMIASDDEYFYRCIGDYDGSTAIWKRVALTSW